MNLSSNNGTFSGAQLPVRGFLSFTSPLGWLSVAYSGVVFLALSFGVVCALVASVENSVNIKPQEYARWTERKWQGVAGSTVGLVPATYLAVHLLTSSLHNGGLWSATNVLVGLLILSSRYVFQLLGALQKTAQELNITRGCYEVLVLQLYYRAIIHVTGTGLCKVRDDGGHISASRLMWANGVPGDVLAPAQFQPKYRLQDINWQTAISPDIRALASEDALIPRWAQWLVDSKLTWVCNDLTTERVLTGSGVVKSIGQRHTLISIFSQELFGAAAQFFVLSARRYKEALRSLMDSQYKAAYDDSLSTESISIQQLAQIFHSVDLETHGLEMSCERYLYKEMCFLGNEEQPIACQLFREYLSLYAYGGERIFPVVQSFVIVALWVQYINMSLVALDLLRMKQNKEELQRGCTFEQGFWDFVNEKAYVGSTLRTEASEEVSGRREGLVRRLYRMSDDRCKELCLLLATAAICEVDLEEFLRLPAEVDAGRDHLQDLVINTGPLDPDLQTRLKQLLNQSISARLIVKRHRSQMQEIALPRDIVIKSYTNVEGWAVSSMKEIMKVLALVGIVAIFVAHVNVESGWPSVAGLLTQLIACGWLYWITWGQVHRKVGCLPRVGDGQLRHQIQGEPRVNLGW